MDFYEEIQALSVRARKIVASIKTEEATKQALVLPFIQILGYDIYDPTEVVPEFIADVGTKKGEKVDYAIMRNGIPILLIECKWSGQDLGDAHISQLYRYFSVTDSRIAILTNGLIYRFYTDLEKPNTMDEKPFLEFDLLNIEESAIPELRKLSKANFDLDQIISAASDLKYTKEIKAILSREIERPSDEFIRFFVSKIYSGRVTQNVIAAFREILKRSLRDFINGEINSRLKSIMSDGQGTEDPPTEAVESTADLSDISGHMSKRQRRDEKIETTQEEIDGFLQVLDILRGTVESHRIVWRDREGHFNILLDDNIRKPICKFYFNTPKKSIAFFDDPKKRGAKHPIQTIAEIKDFTARLVNTVKAYDARRSVDSAPR